MYPHRIRLRGPWEYEVLSRAENEPPLRGRVVMPCAPGAFTCGAGRIRFRRRFGYPGRIDANERVWLVIEGVAGAIEASVNGAVLGGHPGNVEFEVTGLLGSRNELTVDVEDFAPDNGLWVETALEVRCTAYLRKVRVTRNAGEIHAIGEVVGEAAGPLELYLIADRSPGAYAIVTASGGVQPFDLRTDARNADGEPIVRVKIDLVKGAVVWYTVESEASSTNVPEPGA